MSELEKIVRPFQSGEKTLGQAFYTAGQLVPPNITLRYGRSGGSSKLLNTNWTFSLSSYMQRYENEKPQE